MKSLRAAVQKAGAGQSTLSVRELAESYELPRPISLRRLIEALASSQIDGSVLSVRDAAYAVHSPGAKPWGIRDSLSRGFWPPIQSFSGGVSARSFAARYGAAGSNLRTLAAGTKNVWAHIDRSQLIGQLRLRLRDPGIIEQHPRGYADP
jgi:hypothetical protein